MKTKDYIIDQHGYNTVRIMLLIFILKGREPERRRTMLENSVFLHTDLNISKGIERDVVDRIAEKSDQIQC